jgi:uncharacterized protein YecT (DUF1311 family)
MKIRTLLAASLVIMASPFGSSYGQDPDWKPPGTEEAAAVERANTQLDAVYKRLMDKLDTVGQKALKKAQLSWIKWRDDEALLIARLDGAVGGSGLRVDFLTAQAKLISERAAVLKTYLERSDNN